MIGMSSFFCCCGGCFLGFAGARFFLGLSSTSTDSSNYESDEKTEKTIIHNYNEKEPESKLIIKKVRRKNKINHEELKKIYDEVNREEKKTRKRKIDNDNIPKKKRAAPKPKQQQQQQPKQDDIPIIYYI